VQAILPRRKKKRKRIKEKKTDQHSSKQYKARKLLRARNEGQPTLRQENKGGRGCKVVARRRAGGIPPKEKTQRQPLLFRKKEKAIKRGAREAARHRLTSNKTVRIEDNTQ